MPVTLYVKTFRGYSYVKNLAKITVSMPMKMQTARTPGSQGSFSAGSLLDSRTVTIEGTIANDAGAVEDILGLRSTVDTFMSYHREGVAGSFYLHSDRFLNAEVQSVSLAQDEGMPFQAYTAILYCADPFWYSDAVNTVSMSTATVTIPGVGTREVRPTVSFVVAAADGVGGITFTDDQGNSCTVIPAAAQTGTFTVNSLLRKILVGSTDASQVFAGSFLTMSAAGTLTYATTAGLSLTGVPTLTYRDRWI